MINFILRLRTKVLKRLGIAFYRHSLPMAKLLQEQLVIYYRISDAGYPKIKPHYINNELCLRNAIREFPPGKLNRWIVIADNCSEATVEMIKKYVSPDCIELRSVGHGAGTFLLALKSALTLADNTPVYFLENDYLHKTGARSVLMDGLFVSDYVTLYDHPDKYKGQDCGKPRGETTKVLLGKLCHWKKTHSTTMTFASNGRALKEDRRIFERWLTTRHPYDCEIFIDLSMKGRSLISPIPGYSTHGETALLGPLVDWERVESGL